MHLIGLARLGKDAEVRFLPDGTPVANLALAYNYGKKNNEGKRPTQWVEGVLWGDRANSLAQYLVKGQQINVHLSDVRLETYTTNDGRTGSKMIGRVDTLEFAGSRPEGQQQGQTGAPARQSQPQRQAAPHQSAHPDMDEKIPF